MFCRAKDEELPALAALINRAYRSPAGWSAEEPYLEGDRTTAAQLRRDIAAKPSAFLLAWREDGRICGSVWLEPLDAGRWYLGTLATDVEQQNGGLGRRMLAAAEDWARQRGARRIEMAVINVRKGLIAWYERRGYAKTGATRPFPYGDDRFGRPLRDDLCFVILDKRLERD